ncbi:MAG TPA: hypothetical protein VL240_08845, partial [Candidatus Binatia bacterium]|nr:hypothetical protein [Candidatus Binatia bacterium]
MERRYLVTAVAIIATFAGLSRGFHSLQRLAAEHGQHFMAGATCPASAAAQAVARLRTRLHP